MGRSKEGFVRHKCLASLIVFILFFTITTFICLLEFKILFQPQTIITAIDKSNIFENSSKIVEAIFDQDQKADLQTKIFIKGVVASIDPNVAKAEVEKNLVPLFDYFSNKTTTPNVNFDLSLLKTNLKNNLPKILSQELVNLPNCAPGIESNPKGASGLPECLPAGTTPAQLEESMKTSNYIDDLVKEIPDSYSLTENQNTLNSLNDFKKALNILNIAYLASIILSLILIGCLALLGRSYWPSILRWTGLSLVLPAGSIFLLNIASKFMPKILSDQMSQTINPEILDLVNPFFTSVNNYLLQITIYYSAVIFGIGLILIILSYALPHRPDPTIKPKSNQNIPVKNPV